MKKYLPLLMALSVGILTTACSKSFEASYEGSFGGSASKTIEFPVGNTSSPTPKTPSAETPKVTEGSGTSCNKHEECNETDELCLYGACQSVSQIKQTFGFTDDPTFDPCPARPCPNCVSGTQKKTGVGYAINDVSIQSDVCLDCQFSGECNEGLRCVHDRCVDAATDNYCDFFNECLDGFACENSQCAKAKEVPPTE